jgi:TPR repeat protein
MPTDVRRESVQAIGLADPILHGEASLPVKASDACITDWHQMALEEAKSNECDPKLVIELLRKGAANHDARSIYGLAQSYRYGSFGLEVDPKRAHDLTRSLEKSNIGEALFNLAFDYDIGNFVRSNPKKAFSLYMSAALLGIPEASFQISEFYRVGEVVPRNLSLAKAWLKRSKCDEKLISPPYRVWL